MSAALASSAHEIPNRRESLFTLNVLESERVNFDDLDHHFPGRFANDSVGQWSRSPQAVVLFGECDKK